MCRLQKFNIYLQLKGHCISYCSHQIRDEHKLKWDGDYFCLWFKRRSRPSLWGRWLVIFHLYSKRTWWKETRPHYGLLKPTPNNPVPSVRFYLLKVPQLSRTEPTILESQVFQTRKSIGNILHSNHNTVNIAQNLRIQIQFYKYWFMCTRLKTINTECRRKSLSHLNQSCR